MTGYMCGCEASVIVADVTKGSRPFII